MPSPFPGMDPYFEDPAYWEGFHNFFIAECVYQLSGRLPDGYIANAQTRVELISRSDDATKEYVPDVSLGRQKAGSPAPRPGGSSVAVAPEPVTIDSLDAMEVREAYVEVLREPDLEVVAVIEVLSPWNKFGEGIGEYRAKRRQLVGGGIHVVEIDLLVRGQRTALAWPLPPGDCYAMIFNADRKPKVDVWAWTVRQALPVGIPIPLKKPDAPVLLDLAAIVNNVYDRGRYERKLRYHLPCPAPLSPGDVTWAEEVAKRTVRQ